MTCCSAEVSIAATACRRRNSRERSCRPEKYLFHLSKWGVEGERELTSRYGARLPAGLQIRVTNPKALLLLGRDRRPDGKPVLTDTQSFDLEVIKRKYANMMDIVTYDDLLRRLDRILASLTTRVGAGEN